MLLNIFFIGLTIVKRLCNSKSSAEWYDFSTLQNFTLFYSTTNKPEISCHLYFNLKGHYFFQDNLKLKIQQFRCLTASFEVINSIFIQCNCCLTFESDVPQFRDDLSLESIHTPSVQLKESNNSKEVCYTGFFTLTKLPAAIFSERHCFFCSSLPNSCVIVTLKLLVIIQFDFYFLPQTVHDTVNQHFSNRLQYYLEN